MIVKQPEKKKPTPWAKYTWVREENGVFGLVIGEDVFFIWEEHGTWIMTAKIGDKHFRGERRTLEDAAKASDRLLYKNLPKVWTVTDARVIINPWRGDLNASDNSRRSNKFL